MRHNRLDDVRDPAVVRALIAANPFATLVSTGTDGLVASHCPVLLDDDPELAVVTHLGRPDDRTHLLGSQEVLLIVAGPHGYISPSWYTAEATPAPTWNYSVAHCHGVPQLLDDAANAAVLRRLVDHFERVLEHPVALDRAVADRLIGGTVGIRLPIERFTCKVKMSQNQDPESQRNVLAALHGSGPYAHAALAVEMERALDPAGRLRP